MAREPRVDPLSSATFDETGHYLIHVDPRSSHQQIARIIREHGRDPILDVGAAYGFLGQILEPDGRTLDAIEPSPEWAERARRHYRTVFQCSVEDAPLETASYPVVVCADVLEHTVNPAAVLRRLRACATDDARFIVSLPNAVHLSSRVMIALGLFPQHTRGIFDQTHLHFYTRRTVEALFESAGLEVVQRMATPVPFELVLARRWQRPLLAVLMWAQRPLVWLLPTIFAYQWIMVGRVKRAAAPETQAPATVSAPLERAVSGVTRDAGATGTGARTVHALLAALIIALVLLPLASAAAGFRLISAYAARPVVSAALVREVRYTPQGDRPMSGAQGVAVAANGTVFVADESPRRFLAYPKEGTTDAVVLAAATSPQRLVVPYAAAIAPSGDAYLLDRGTGDVHVFSPDGEFVRSLKLSVPEARGLAFDADGGLYLLETGNGRVRRLKPDLQPDAAWGDGKEPASTFLGGDTGGIAVIGRTVFVSRPNTIFRIDAQGRIEARVPLLGNPGMMAALGERLYMTDISTGRLWVLDREGNTIGRVVRDGGDEKTFGQPRGVAVDGRGRLYVMDDTRLMVYQLSAQEGP